MSSKSFPFSRRSSARMAYRDESEMDGAYASLQPVSDHVCKVPGGRAMCEPAQRPTAAGSGTKEGRSPCNEFFALNMRTRARRRDVYDELITQLTAVACMWNGTAMPSRPDRAVSDFYGQKMTWVEKIRQKISPHERTATATPCRPLRRAEIQAPRESDVRGAPGVYGGDALANQRPRIGRTATARSCKTSRWFLREACSAPLRRARRRMTSPYGPGAMAGVPPVGGWRLGRRPQLTLKRRAYYVLRHPSMWYS
jgi:hypothetical protein